MFATKTKMFYDVLRATGAFTSLKAVEIAGKIGIKKSGAYALLKMFEEKEYIREIPRNERIIFDELEEGFVGYAFRRLRRNKVQKAKLYWFVYSRLIQTDKLIETHVQDEFHYPFPLSEFL
ncbi:MAG: hypothetical protein HY367_03470 [Candidatus Aenigmarchaeota archaeon]|nr:hypothetical protein [Candidatus Aenigmarchaeota archaeon]